MDFTPEQSALLLDIARQTIIAQVTRREADLMPSPVEPIPPGNDLLHQPAGCFVTLHELTTHRLRGCVGRIEADMPMMEAVRSAAVSVLGDPRFTRERVTRDDLPLLEVEVSLLSPLRIAASPLDFDPLNDGIVLNVAGRKGLFLPQVARETGWTREQLLARLCVEKMDLPADAWQDASASLETFSTAILGPETLLNLR